MLMNLLSEELWPPRFSLKVVTNGGAGGYGQVSSLDSIGTCMVTGTWAPTWQIHVLRAWHELEAPHPQLLTKYPYSPGSVCSLVETVHPDTLVLTAHRHAGPACECVRVRMCIWSVRTSRRAAFVPSTGTCVPTVQSQAPTCPHS